MDYQKLNLLFRCGKEFNHQKIRQQELSDTECMICSYVNSHDRCSQDDVSVALKTDKTTVGKALASLETKGCVARFKDEADKRVKRLSLTALGHEKVDKLINLHDCWLRDVMACLTAEEQRQFESFCDRLLDAAEKMKQNQGGARE